MECVICAKPIPVARLECQPRTLTCSKRCSATHTKNLRRKAKLAWDARQRAKA